MLFKIANLFVKKPLSVINIALDGKKTYLAGAIMILPALACMVQFLLNAMPLDLGDINKLLHSDCLKQLGEGLAIIGFRSALPKKAE